MKNEQQNLTWPISAFNFKVTIGNKGDIAFQEVSGLDTEYDAKDYRANNSPYFSTMKNMPGGKKHSDICLKKGLFTGNQALMDYFANIKMNAVAFEAVTIQLLDESQKALFTWTLTNALVKKVSYGSLQAKNDEMAIEELVLFHEGLNMTT